MLCMVYFPNNTFQCIAKESCIGWAGICDYPLWNSVLKSENRFS